MFAKSIIHVRKPSSGFTLVELLVSIAVVGVLAAISVANYEKYKDSANFSVAITELTAYATAIDTYFVENGVFPGDAFAGNLYSSTVSSSQINDIFPSNFGDPWGRAYFSDGCNSMCSQAHEWGGDWGTSVCSAGPDATWQSPWNQAPTGSDDICYFFKNRVKSWNY